jgi:peptidoglycan/LPS O-acetylase OafA/YrhL
MTVVNSNAPPAAVDLRPLDGIRALSNLWICIFHALFLIIGFLPEQEVEKLAKGSYLLQHGYLAVDGFFVLTGLLLAMPLLRKSELPDDKWAYLRRYYSQRLLRIMLPLCLTLLFACQWLFKGGAYLTGLVRLKPAAAMMERFFGKVEYSDSGAAMAPVSLVHLSFLMPYNGSPIHGWSVGVQYQLYLWAPLALLALKINSLPRALKFTLPISLFSLLYRAFTRAHHSMFEKGSIIGGALDLWHYSHPFSRAHTIVAGVLLAFIIWRSTIPAWLSRKGSLAVNLTHAACWLVTAIVFYVCVSWEQLTAEDYRYNRTSPVKHTLFVMFLSIGSLGTTFAWCWLVLCSIFRWGPFAASSLLFSTSSSQKSLVGNSKKVDDGISTASTSSTSTMPPSPSHSAASRGRRRASSNTRGRSPAPARTRTPTKKQQQQLQDATPAKPAPPVTAAATSVLPLFAPTSPSFFGLGLSSFLSNSFLKLLADLSYWCYLLHLYVYTVIYTRPWFWYPPSGEDFKPASLVVDDQDGSMAGIVAAGGTLPQRFLTLANGTSVLLSHADMTLANTNRTFFVPSPESVSSSTSSPFALVESAFYALLRQWFSLREQVWPSGQPLTLSGLYLIAIIGAVLSYLACYVALKWVEEPLRDTVIRKWLFRGNDKRIETVAWWYSVLMMVIGVVGQLAGTAWVLFVLRPEMESQIAVAAGGGGSASASPSPSPAVAAVPAL